MKRSSKIHSLDLEELRGLKPSGRIAVVLHMFEPALWDEMREAIDRILCPFDLFVSLTKGVSDHRRDEIVQAFPHAHVFDFENHGRDIGPFLVFLQSGVLFKYDLVCKLHTKRSPYMPNGDTQSQALTNGILGSSETIDLIVRSFSQDPDLGMVVAEGDIFHANGHGAGLQELLSRLLPKIGISPDVGRRSVPGGSIFWIRSFLLRTIAGLGLTLSDLDPEPVPNDGTLCHALEQIFGLVCEDAGMRVAERSSLAPVRQRSSPEPGIVNVVAYYLPQFYPIPENNEWWGDGFTEWTNVTRARPLFAHHRQPRLPADLGFYDLRLAETREAQAALARNYGVTAFCYHYYWFNGRRILNRPLDEVFASGKPDFPFMICWANEPWSRSWDGLAHDVLLSQTYEPGWERRFAIDIAPLLRDPRYLRLNGKPMLLIYRIAHIPDSSAAVTAVRQALSEQGVPEIHLAAAWASFPDDKDNALPEDPDALGLDAYFEFPPHMSERRPLWPLPPDLPEELRLYDYNSVVSTALVHLDETDAGRRHKGVMAGWDNTPRRKDRGHTFHGATPANFRRWLRGVVGHERNLGGERVVFVNAWNEWAEGTYLEPDQDFGRGWLEAVASATGTA